MIKKYKVKTGSIPVALRPITFLISCRYSLDMTTSTIELILTYILIDFRVLSSTVAKYKLHASSMSLAK